MAPGSISAAAWPTRVFPRRAREPSLTCFPARDGALYPYHKNWQPRASFAYSPNGSSGISKFLFGGPGKTSIRAGFGTYYDEIGQPLASTINATAFGLASTLSTAANVYDSTQVPRFTGFNSLPTQLLPPAPKGGFPATYPNIFAITNSIDDNLKAPYSMNLNFSIGREFSHGFFVQGSYVGRLSRHSLMQRDLAMPTNLRDPKSGQTYFQAMSQLATQLDFSGVSVANLQKIPFFENLWATAAGGGFTATQAVAKDYLERSNPGDFTNVLNDMDNIQACSTTGSTFSAAGKITKLGCGILGPNAMWSPQFSALSAWSSLGSGAYHSMQWTVRKRFSDGIQFDLNYTLLEVDRSGFAFGELRQLQFGLHDQLVGSEPAARRVAVRRSPLRERASWCGNCPSAAARSSATA